MKDQIKNKTYKACFPMLKNRLGDNMETNMRNKNFGGDPNVKER